MMKLTLLRGASGSGKSRWASRQDAVIVSRDAIRSALFGSESMHNEPLVTAVQDRAIEEALRDGNDVIVDNTNVEVKYLRPLAEIGMFCGAEIEIKVFDKSLLRCLENNARRAAEGGRNVPAEVIQKQWERLEKTKNITVNELVFSDFVPVEKSDAPDAVIIDIDGTLAHITCDDHENNCTCRTPFDEHRVGEDAMDVAVAEIAYLAINANIHVILMSSRSEKCRNATKKWLDGWGLLDYTRLLMRGEKDNRRDYIVKYDLFNENVRDRFNVLFAIDDRWQVRQMWTKLGIKVFDASTDGGHF